MADIPTPRSYQQILGDSIDVLLSKAGLKGVKVGGPIAEALETISQSQARTSQDIFKALASRDVDNADGEALKRLGKDENIEQRPATFASTTVTVGDSSFTKIASRVYQGKPAPAAGSTSIFISDASKFPSSGSIYIGRGTTNLEGPLSYVSRTQDGSGTFWTLTLSSPTSRFHNLSESVVLSQGGDRLVPSTTTVGTLQGNATNAVKFAVTTSYTLPDGEDTLAGVRVVCQSPGIVGNVPQGAISTFDAIPFTGATVTNPLRVVNALAPESKEDFRERIKNKRRSKVKGIPLAITTEVFGATASDEDATVTSASLVSDTLYVDDGTGYEEKATGVAIESLVEDAAGGEVDLQIVGGTPIAKAYIQATNRAPYALSDGAALTARVGGVVSTLTFVAAGFRDIANASAYEVVAAINSSPGSLFSARTTDSGQRFSIFAKADVNEDLQVLASSGTDANTFFGFPLARFDTLRLYRNDKLIYKDGLEAFIETTSQSVWDNSAIVDGISFDVTVDGTSTVTYTFHDIDFVNASTGYKTVNANNSLSAWASIINAKVPGITALVESDRLKLVSNLGANSRALLTITPSAGMKSMFASATVTVTGRDNDYSLNRNTGELHVTKPLAEGETLSAGTIYTRAYIESADFSSHTIAVGGANLWWVVDGAAQVIPTGVAPTTLLTVTGTNLVTLTSGTAVFGNIQKHDWLILWDPNFGTLAGMYRVSDVTSTTVTFEFGGTPAGFPGTVTPANLGFVVVRTSAMLQKLAVPAGIATPATLATLIAAQMQGVSAATVRTTRLRVTTDTFGSEGDISLVAADIEGAKLPLTIGTIVNEVSHLASAESGNSDHGTPNFDFASVTTGAAGYVQASANSLAPGQGLVWLNQITAAGNRAATNLGSKSVVAAISGGNIFAASPFIAWVGDRLFGCSLFAFGPEDLLSLVLDGDAISKSFSTPLAYKVHLGGNSPGYYGATVAAYNSDGTALNTIFPSFDFSGFFLYPQARAVANPPVDAASTLNSVLWRFKRFGPDGNKARVSYTNPTAPSQDFGVSSAQGDLLDVFVSLPSGAARAITTGQRYAVESALYGGGANLRKVCYYAGVRAALAFVSANNFSATITTGGGAPNPYITNHRFLMGDTFYLNGGGSYPAGFCTVTSVTSGTIFNFAYVTSSLAPGSGTDTANCMAANLASSPAVPLGFTGVAVGDICTIGTNSRLDASCQGTFRVADFDSGNGLWVLVHRPTGSALSFNYADIVSTSNLQIFPIDTTKTNTSGTPNIATRVNALAGNLWVSGSIPVYSKSGTPVLAGAYLPITISTLDAYLEDQTQPQNGYTFSSGSYYIQQSVFATGAYQLTINGTPYAGAASWSSDEDWTNEYAYVVPVTTSSLVRYLNLPSITGLSPNSELKAVARGGKLQIGSLLPGSAGSVQVSGGTANGVLAPVFNTATPTATGCAVQVKAADAVGLFGGQWVALQALTQTPKRLDWTTATVLSLTAGSPNSTIAVSGAGTVAKYAGAMTAALTGLGWQIEQQGKFAAYVYTGGGAPTNFSGVQEGDWVQITSVGGSSVNKGIKRVVRVSYAAGKYAFWVENASAVEENVTLDTVTFWTADSILPGDIFTVNSTVLDVAGQTSNEGIWTVQALGVVTAGVVSSFTVQGTMTTASATLNGDVRNMQALPAAPSRLIKRISYVSPAADVRYAYVVFNTQSRLTEITAAAGTYITPLDKFSFDTSVAVGLDGYRYDTGLIAECNKILYGDARDPDTYPGVVAKGADISISGPLVHRVQVSLSIRVRQGTPKDVQERVQGAVAGVINAAGVGESISIADIIAAAKRVRGVAGVTIISPTYGPGSDQISVQSFEKPMVLNLDTDVLVSLTGA